MATTDDDRAEERWYRGIDEDDAVRAEAERIAAGLMGDTGSCESERDTDVAYERVVERVLPEARRRLSDPYFIREDHHG